MRERFDVAVVGAGILGLAHAYQWARRGARVLVLERGERAVGASIRNFGMLWPIGQPSGPLYDLARHSLDHWLTVLRASGAWHEQTGSLHLAYQEDEAAVLDEFVREVASDRHACQLIDPSAALARSPMINPHGLRTALWSPIETCVDPRQVIATLPRWLAETFGVRFVFGITTTAYDPPHVHGGGAEFIAEQLIVCAGDDLQTLYPDALGEAGLVRCKLQMMRSVPCPESRLGPMLAAGLTLRHYRAFEGCRALAQVGQRFDRDLPAYGQYGIHVMASQNGAGELTLGDSHEYGSAVAPFDRTLIDDLILDYLRTFLVAPQLRIASRWHGTYVKHRTAAYVVIRPAPRVVVVTGLGGAGMTLSFGLADTVVAELAGA
jgi:FAD dependent oxidoreductase TIGR03364